MHVVTYGFLVPSLLSLFEFLHIRIFDTFRWAVFLSFVVIDSGLGFLTCLSIILSARTWSFLAH